MIGRFRKYRLFRARRMSGGVRLPDYTAASMRSRIMPTPLAPQMFLPLPESGDFRLEAETGERVARQQLLVSSTDDGLPLLHSPASGLLQDIVQHPLLRRGGRRQSCLLLSPDSADRSESLEPIEDYRSEIPATIADRLRQSRSLAVASGSRQYLQTLAALRTGQTELIILRAIDGDPYISARAALIREHAEEVLVGASILQYAFGADRCVIAMPDGKSPARDELEAVMADSAVELMLTPRAYPAHEEQQLIRAATGRGRMQRDEALARGIVVLDVGCAFAAARAVSAGEAFTSRIVTLAGSGLKTPKNFRVPLGTPAGHLLALCGSDDIEPRSTLAQGVMTGYPVADASAPIDELSEGLVSLVEADVEDPVLELPCIRCGQCSSVCPAHLQPQRLTEAVAGMDAGVGTGERVMDCIECGACAYVCPSHIPLVDLYRQAKAAVVTREAGRQQSAHWQRRFQIHQALLRRTADTANEASRAEQASTADTSPGSFSRDHARDEIAAAVARVKARRQSMSGSAGSESEK